MSNNSGSTNYDFLQRSKGQSSRKSQTKSAKSHSHNAAKSETSPKQSSLQTLIIGDSILSGINQRGLRNKVECQPISGASVDLLLEKVQIYDLKKIPKHYNLCVWE